MREEAQLDPEAPEDFLWLALRADTAHKREKFARAGLALDEEDLDPDTQVLLLRQLYLAHLARRRLRDAAEVARQMTSVGAMADVAHHDAARALWALGEVEAAIGEQRLAARAAPGSRRSFHAWSLATWQHFAGDTEGALTSIRRARRWAGRAGPLLRAHEAYIKLDAGRGVRRLDEILRELQKSRSREGYGQFLLGMLTFHMGDTRRAAPHLRSFLRRNASADEAKALTLREELRRARLALAKLESD